MFPVYHQFFVRVQKDENQPILFVSENNNSRNALLFPNLVDATFARSEMIRKGYKVAEVIEAKTLMPIMWN